MTNTPVDAESHILSHILARGGSSTLIVDGDRHVIKCFLPTVPAGVAHREAALARIVRAAGVKTPAALDVMTWNGSPAIRYERCHGVSLLTCLLRDVLQVSVFAQRLAAVHVELHQLKASELPSLGAQLRIALSSHSHYGFATLRARHESFPQGPHWSDAREEIERILRPVNDLDGVSLTEDDQFTICHNDFQPSNVLVDQQQTWIVDWLNAACGPALADLAQTSLLLRFAPLPAEFRDTLPKERIDLESLRLQFHHTYLQTYYRLAPFSLQQLAAWLHIRALAWPTRFPQPCLDPDQPWGDVQFE